MDKFWRVAKSKSGKRVFLCCQWWGVCVGRGGSFNSNGLFGCWRTEYDMWMYTLVMVQSTVVLLGLSNKNCMLEQIMVELLVTHMAFCFQLGQPVWQKQVLFPQNKSDQATGTCWPHVLCPQQMQGNMTHERYNRARWYRWRSADTRVFC